MSKKYNATDKTKFYMNICIFHYTLIISHWIVLHNKFYHIIFMGDQDYMKI